MSGFNNMPYLNAPPPMVRPAMGSFGAAPIVPPHLQGNVHYNNEQDNYLYNMMSCASEMAVKKALQVVVEKPLEEIKSLLTEIKESLQSDGSSAQILQDQAKDICTIKEAVEDNYKKALNKATKLKDFKTSMESLINGLKEKVSTLSTQFQKDITDKSENNEIENLKILIEGMRNGLEQPFKESLTDIKDGIDHLKGQVDALTNETLKLGSDFISENDEDEEKPDDCEPLRTLDDYEKKTKDLFGQTLTITEKKNKPSGSKAQPSSTNDTDDDLQEAKPSSRRAKRAAPKNEEDESQKPPESLALALDILASHPDYEDRTDIEQCILETHADYLPYRTVIMQSRFTGQPIYCTNLNVDNDRVLEL